MVQLGHDQVVFEVQVSLQYQIGLVYVITYVHT